MHATYVLFRGQKFAKHKNVCDIMLIYELIRLWLLLIVIFSICETKWQKIKQNVSHKERPNQTEDKYKYGHKNSLLQTTTQKTLFLYDLKHK